MTPFDFRKVFYHTNNLIDLSERGDSWPIHMQVGLISTCNHRCVFCHGGHSANKTELFKPAVMDLNIILNCLKQAKAHGLKAVTFVGNGEPLLYPYIDELFEALRKLEIEIGVFSNGAMLNESRRKFIAEYATFIRFSVNGSNTAEHNEVHQCNGDFPKIMENIRCLIEMRNAKRQTLPTIGTQMVIYEKNYRSIYNAAKFWKDLGVDYFEIKPLISTGFDLEKPVRPASDKEDVRRLMKKAEELSDDNFKVYAKYGMYAETLLPNIKRSYDKCLGSALSVNLLENGDVTICPHLELSKEQIFGNINEKSFEEVWTSDRRKKILEKLDVHGCPPACKQHKLNEILWDYLYPKKENHINFL